MSASNAASPIRGYILVLEPSHLFRDVIERSCAARGLAVYSANDVGEAIHKLEDEQPLCVMTANELKGIPGSALVTALKSTPTCRFLPIALMTSDIDASVSQTVFPPDMILEKNARFEKAVGSFLSLAMLGKIDPIANHQEDHLYGKHVLLAEDSTDTQVLVGRLLHRAGMNVAIACDGHQAIMVGGRGHYDLILMDIEMPKMDGLEALVRLREQRIQAPIIALTAHTSLEFRQKALSAGFDDIVPKPNAREVLLDTCRRHLLIEQDQTDEHSPLEAQAH